MAKDRYRYLILAAVRVQLCLGATYSWIVFVEPLKKTLSVSQASTSGGWLGWEKVSLLV